MFMFMMLAKGHTCPKMRNTTQMLPILWGVLS